MRISEIYKLEKLQHELDFIDIDIDIERDTPCCMTLRVN